MARPTLTIETEINEACDTMNLWDTTADYGGGTVTTASVESVVIVVNNKSTGTYFTYTFTVGTNIITAATLSLDGGTATDILAELSSTAWPFIVDVNEFDLFADYGVTLPDFTDGVYQPEYSIIRTTATAFNYTTSVATLKDCTTCCCISGKFAALDPNCGCSSKALDLAIQADTWLKTARAAASMGDVTKAVEALAKADELCNCDCVDCD